MSGRRILVRYPSGQQALIVGDFWGPGYLGGEPQIPWHRIDEATGWPPDLSDDGKAVAILVTEASYTNDGRRLEPRSVAMLDPRAVCEDESTGERLFAPSMNTPGTCQWVVEWLREHQEWPPMIEARPPDRFMCDWCHSLQPLWAGYQGMKDRVGQEICRECMRGFVERQEKYAAETEADAELSPLRLKDVAAITRLSVDHDITAEQAADWFYHGTRPDAAQPPVRLASGDGVQWAVRTEP